MSWPVARYMTRPPDHDAALARFVEAQSHSYTAAIAAPGSAETLLGDVDAMKLRSSLTLFAAIAEDPVAFRAGLDHFFGGQDDPATLALLDRTAHDGS